MAAPQNGLVATAKASTAGPSVPVAGSAAARGMIDPATGVTVGQLQDEQAKRLKAAEDAAAKLRAELDDLSEIVLITPELVGLRGGGLFREGDVIDRGRHKGKRVGVINFPSGVCGLSDGTILHVGG